MVHFVGQLDSGCWLHQLMLLYDRDMLHMSAMNDDDAAGGDGDVAAAQQLLTNSDEWNCLPQLVLPLEWYHNHYAECFVIAPQLVVLLLYAADEYDANVAVAAIAAAADVAVADDECQILYQIYDGQLKKVLPNLKVHDVADESQKDCNDAVLLCWVVKNVNDNHGDDMAVLTVNDHADNIHRLAYSVACESPQSQIQFP